MKPVHVALIAVATLAVGGFAGYLLGHDTSAPPPVAHTPEIAEDPDRAGPVPEPVTRADAPRRSTQPDQPAPPKVVAPVGPTQNTIASLLAAMADDVPQSGTGRVHGVVTGPTGQGIAGATITASARLPRDRVRYDPSEPFEKRIENDLRRQHFYEKGKLTTQSDDSGRYEFTALGDYDFMMECKVPGYRFEMSGDVANYRQARPDAEINFRGKAVCEVEFDIRLPGGTQPAQASVKMERNNGSSGHTWFPGQPSIQFEPGTHTMTITAGEHQEFASEPTEFKAEAGPVQRLTVQLAHMASIVCRVKMPEGSSGHEGYPGRAGGVTLQANPPAAAPTEIPRGEGVRNNERWGSSGGEEVFSGLTPGTYRLILAQNRRVIAWKDVAVTSGVHRETLAPPEPVAADYLIVRVLYADGRAATGANLRAQYSGAPADAREGMIRDAFGRGSGASVLARPDGSYWVERPQATDAILKGTWKYAISGNAPEYGPFSHEHPGDGASQVTINLPAPSHLTLYFTGAATHPRKSSIEVQLMHQVSEGSWNGVGNRAGIADTVKFGPIPPGRYRMTLRLNRREVDDGMPWDSELGGLTFDVTAGENVQTFTVPLIHRLTLLIADPKSVQMLQLQRGDGGGSRHLMRQQITEKTVIDGLAAGDWIITSRNEGMKVNLNADLEVTFSPKAFDCVVVTGLKSGGVIEGLGLRSGDKVIRVDGEDGATGADIQRLIGASYSKETTTWTVQRAGATVNVTFNGQELSKAMMGRGTERENFSTRQSMRD